jgi:creatinine amidohydrolase
MNMTDNGSVRQNRQEAGGDNSDEMPTGPILLADLTSDATGALHEAVEIVLIPVGAHEQHGPALPVATDTFSAQVVCALVGTLMRPRVAIAPAIPWGVSWAHMDRSGTISLRPETLIALVTDIVGSLTQHGFKKYMLVNGHGGNNAALRLAAEHCRTLPGKPLVVPVYAYNLIAAAAREYLDESAPGHGGGDEASIMLSIRPDLVRREALHNPEVDRPLMLMSQILGAVNASLPVPQSAYSASGTTGDASKASPEAGQRILGEVTNQLRAIIEQLLETAIP